MIFNLCNAIKNRQVVEFSYGGGVRTVEPFILGENKEGKLLLRCFQIDGYSASGNPCDWKLFAVDDMSVISGAGANFSQTRPDYNPEDPEIAKILCKY